MVEILAAVQQSKAADPNIILPALFAIVPATVIAIGGLATVLWNLRSNRKATNAMHDEIRTNHGMKAGEYLENIKTVVDWAEVHAKEDNELRSALGLTPGAVPRWRSRSESDDVA